MSDCLPYPDFVHIAHYVLSGSLTSASRCLLILRGNPFTPFKEGTIHQSGRVFMAAGSQKARISRRSCGRRNRWPAGRPSVHPIALHVQHRGKNAPSVKPSRIEGFSCSRTMSSHHCRPAENHSVRITYYMQILQYRHTRRASVAWQHCSFMALAVNRINGSNAVAATADCHSAGRGRQTIILSSFSCTSSAHEKLARECERERERERERKGGVNKSCTRRVITSNVFRCQLSL